MSTGRSRQVSNGVLSAVRTFCVEQVCEIAGEIRETKQARAKIRRREEDDEEAMAFEVFWCGVVWCLIRYVDVCNVYIDGERHLKLWRLIQCIRFYDEGIKESR